MHIFITGIAGFLGSNLAEFYIKRGFKVSGCDNLVGGDLDNVHPDVIFYQFFLIKIILGLNLQILLHQLL